MPLLLQPAKRISQALCWCPPWCQQNTERTTRSTTWLIILYACAGGFTSANLYYSHPILNVLANDFGATQAQIANIPTLALAGDATGLLLVLPLADFFPRRRFVLLLILCAGLLWYALEPHHHPSVRSNI